LSSLGNKDEDKNIFLSDPNDKKSILSTYEYAMFGKLFKSEVNKE
jgi:hypothetical protein